MRRDEPKPFFGDRVANAVLETHIDKYKDERLAAGASKVTINRELAVLKRAFTLGSRRRLVRTTPYIELFPEPPPREGHYEQEELVRFLDAANAVKAEKNFDGRVVADIVMFAYFSGWRLKESAYHCTRIGLRRRSRLPFSRARDTR